MFLNEFKKKVASVIKTCTLNSVLKGFRSRLRLQYDGVSFFDNLCNFFSVNFNLLLILIYEYFCGKRKSDQYFNSHCELKRINKNKSYFYTTVTSDRKRKHWFK